jgi:hypothetical protein
MRRFMEMFRYNFTPEEKKMLLKKCEMKEKEI